MGILYFLLSSLWENLWSTAFWSVDWGWPARVFVFLRHLFGVHDLYSLYRYYVYVFLLACEVYRSSRSRHRDSNRYFSFCQKKSRFFCSFFWLPHRFVIARYEAIQENNIGFLIVTGFLSSQEWQKHRNPGLPHSSRVADTILVFFW